MLYQIALDLFKSLNEDIFYPRTETVRILSQMVCTRRQVLFEIFKSNKTKIGLNSAENKLYHINKRVALNDLNLNFVHFKSLMKSRFLKFGNT